jgi:hypothetical protein
VPAHVAPAHKSSAFNCPHCEAYSKHEWAEPIGAFLGQGMDAEILEQVISRGGHPWTSGWTIAVCTHCGGFSLWLQDRLVYPSSGGAPLPNPDLPADIMSDYEEARSIVSLSPRGAAALLRLVIDKLCDYLQAKGDTLNQKIGALVAAGLDPKIQKSLDTVRVVGNEAVHPGHLDLRDDHETAQELFRLVNVIAESTISVPKHIDEIYEEIVPDTAKRAISKRDKPG